VKEPARKVAAAVLVERGRVLIARRKDGLAAGYWELPGGKVEDGETPIEALVRELREELGITARVGAPFGESVCRYGQGTIHLLAFWASLEEGEPEPRVHGEIRWVSPGRLAGYAFAPADRPLVEKLRTQRNGRLGPNR
jgi:8-oxo-dGTP diphosphatase